MGIKKQKAAPTETSEQKEWGPVRIALVAVTVALVLDFCVFVVSGRSDLFSTLFHHF